MRKSNPKRTGALGDRPDPVWRVARASLSLFAAVLLALNVAHSSPKGQLRPDAGSDAVPTHSLQLLSPGPTGQSSHNQRLGARPYTVAIDDDAATVRPGQRTVRGIAKGMKNVAVIVPAGGSWFMTQPAADGSFSVDVQIPDENGPLPVEILSWDSPPNNPNYKVELKARIILFVSGGKENTLDDATRPGNPAAGMKLVWSDGFSKSLSVSSSPVRDADWFVGGKPSSTGSQYSDALFVKADDTRKPFFQRDGFLRIRATHDPAMEDEWKRTWWSGHLSTGFPDGSASIEFRQGYAEVRMMMPPGQGPWPAFWMLDSANTLPSPAYGAVEIDAVEGYGHDPLRYMATAHKWPLSGSTDDTHVEQAQRISLSGNPNSFHTFGVKVTADEVTWYCDGREVHRVPLYSASKVSPFFIMLDLAMGGGWPIVPPPSGNYDLWIDYVRVYQ